MDNKEKENLIIAAEAKYAGFMDVLFPGWRDDPHQVDTPRRVAKSFVNDICSSLFSEEPKMTSFDNISNASGIVFEEGIEVKSICAHHHLPFVGTACVAYFPGNKQIGLSKLNRVVEFFSRRPQVQERLTLDILNYLNTKLEGNRGVAVFIEAKHQCCSLRGVKHNSTMKTVELSGLFISDPSCKEEFYNLMKIH